MDIATTRQKQQAVSVEVDSITMTGFVERDPTVVSFVAGSPDLDKAVSACISIEARALEAADAAIDARVVEEAFDGLTIRFSEQVSEATL